MAVTEKRKNKKNETPGKRHKKMDKPGRTHKTIVKILQKKKREKRKREADPSADEVVIVSAADCALKLTGLPFSATEKEITDWFQDDGIKVEEVHVCGKVRKTGMAYVTMKKKSALKKGIGKNKQHMGERYINVELKLRKEMNEVLQLADIMDKSVFLRGLPFELYRLDILRFFKGLDIAPHGIHIRNKGFGIVEFTDSKTAEEALKKNNEYIRDRYIRVFPCRMKNLVEMRDQIFTEKKKCLDPEQYFKGEKKRKTSETIQTEGEPKEMDNDEEETIAESIKEENDPEETIAESIKEENDPEETKAENIVEENDEDKSDDDAEMEVEDDSEKISDSEVKNEGIEEDAQQNGEETKPTKGKRKTAAKVVQDKFSPRRLRSRTGTPVKSPKRLGNNSARKSKK